MCRMKLILGKYFEELKAKKLTQTSIATALGVERTKLNRIINGHKTCPADLAEKWADLMGVEVEELFEEVGETVEVTE